MLETSTTFCEIENPLMMNESVICCYAIEYWGEARVDILRLTLTQFEDALLESKFSGRYNITHVVSSICSICNVEYIIAAGKQGFQIVTLLVPAYEIR